MKSRKEKSLRLLSLSAQPIISHARRASIFRWEARLLISLLAARCASQKFHVRTTAHRQNAFAPVRSAKIVLLPSSQVDLQAPHGLLTSPGQTLPMSRLANPPTGLRWLCRTIGPARPVFAPAALRRGRVDRRQG